MKKTEDGQSGSDCMEESDEFDDGAEHEYDSEDSSDPEEEVGLFSVFFKFFF